MRLTRFRIILISAIAIIIIAGWIYKIHRDTLRVETYTVKTGLVENIVSSLESGILEPARSAKLTAQTIGTVKEILKEEGDRVEPGDVIIKLEDKDIRARVQLQRANIEVMEARLRIVRGNLENLRKKIEKLQNLYKEGAISETQMEDAQTQLHSVENELIAAEAGVAQAREGLNIAMIELEKTSILAPFEGTITEINAKVGESTISTPDIPERLPASPSMPQNITASSIGSNNYLCKIIDDREFFVKARFDEIDAFRIKTGAPARLMSEALPGGTIEGVVHSISPHISGGAERTRSIDVKVKIKNHKSYRFLPGMSMDVDIIVDSVMDSIVIPTNTIIKKKGGQFVFVLNGSRVEERKIKTGISNWDWTEVREGLKVGEKVIISLDLKELKDGARAKENHGEPD